MKINFNISIIVFLLLIFSSCEKVIELDLADSKEAIVIEATISNNNEPFTVLISKTLPYFDSKTDNQVSGAIVRVSDENGKKKYFKEVSPGVYKLSKITAMPNSWYTIDVEYEGITYSARSYLNEPVHIEELSFSYFDGFGFFDSGYKVSCYIRDPLDIQNYYRIKYYVNGKPSNVNGEISLYTDKLFDGKSIGIGQRTVVFEKTDTLTVELQSIDKAAYEYFLTLENISGTDIIQSASPANPNSNFNNGALGYFSAYSVDRKTVSIGDYIK